MNLMILIIISLCAIASIVMFILSIMQLNREVTNKEELKLIVYSMRCDGIKTMILGGAILIINVVALLLSKL